MTKFKITVARIEEITADGRDSQVRVTFHIDCGPIRFQIPIFLNMTDFDDTEMVQAARDVLHRIFVDLAAQTHEWKLTVEELQQLSSMSLRPKALSSLEAGALRSTNNPRSSEVLLSILHNCSRGNDRKSKPDVVCWREGRFS